MFVTITRTIGDTAMDAMVINKNKLINLTAEPCYVGFDRSKFESVFVRFKIEEGNSFEFDIRAKEMTKHLKEGKELDIEKTAASMCHNLRMLLNSDACGAIAINDEWLAEVIVEAK